MAFKDRPYFRRILDFDDLIRRARGVNATSLAKRWETSTKTVQRFIEQMRSEFDAPIEYDRQRASYFYTDAAYRLPWLPVNGKDLFAIGVAMKVLQIYDGTPAAADMKVIFERLAQLMPAEMRVLPSSLMERLYVQPMPLRLVSPEVWESVATALRERTTLEISYRKPNVKEATREIEPYGLVLAASNWIVVARDPGDGLVKNFYVSRMARARVLGTRYAVPKDFSAERHFGESLGIFTGKDSFRFRVRFGKESAAWISEVSWHPKQKMTRLASGEVELDLPSSSMWEARRFVLSFGKLARAMSPPELVEDVKRELREAAAVYG